MKTAAVSPPMNTITEVLDGRFSAPQALALYGPHIRLLETRLAVSIRPEPGGLTLSGTPSAVQAASRLLVFLADARAVLPESELKFYIRRLLKEPGYDLDLVLRENLRVSRQGKLIRSLGMMQARYLEALREHDVVFAIGPAGTGKTYLAVAHAVSRLVRDEVGRLVLVRPVVEAGERLGYLPGDLVQKIDPYLRPLYDAIFEMIGNEAYAEYTERGRIEIAPLAFMRGRTLNNAIVILDEAQNATRAQMKMFLTRLGAGSSMIITGDVTQIDLPGRDASGLVEAARLIEGVPGTAFIRFSREDVVRHPLVQRIIDAYEKDSSGELS